MEIHARQDNVWRDRLDRLAANVYGSGVYSDLSHIASNHDLDLEALRAKLRQLPDAELISFGQRMRGLVYPLTYGGDGKPSVSAFSIQLREARHEWRRRYPKPTS